MKLAMESAFTRGYIPPELWGVWYCYQFYMTTTFLYGPFLQFSFEMGGFMIQGPR